MVAFTRMIGLAAGLVLLHAARPAEASSLVYQPVNPAFGGPQLNGSWLQAEANAQNIPQAAAQRRQQITGAAASAARGGILTPGQAFAQQLQTQLYSSLANQITRAIFGENAQPNGQFSFQGTTISYTRVGSNVSITINDGSTVTTVTVPATP
ncbi:conserved hypothetical protein [Methylobacterium sp. 4-46]|uniref:curli production assembly/transport component CsgF n=1 Tax=unclassified Methylobacterium TaxID=2615210 RepID=UPI000152C642|nr:MULTISPECIES: curli production assembly/transport component CsgF [Methylobacterium]ACA16870.1 conserved hypothetical protein [Methylobacterium sp. 4-46]WFT82560.1 curli assembly protein CsgF [Methylobacterium nodulans]